MRRQSRYYNAAFLITLVHNALDHADQDHDADPDHDRKDLLELFQIAAGLDGRISLLYRGLTPDLCTTNRPYRLFASELSLLASEMDAVAADIAIAGGVDEEHEIDWTVEKADLDLVAQAVGEILPSIASMSLDSIAIPYDPTGGTVLTTANTDAPYAGATWDYLRDEFPRGCKRA